MPRKQILLKILSFACVATAASCSSIKYVPEGDYILRGSDIKSYDKDFAPSLMGAYVQQHPNSRWFSLFNIPLSIYNASGRDTTKWHNRLLRRMGEPPVLFDSTKAVISCRNMENAMKAMGYLEAKAGFSVEKKGRKAHVRYELFPNRLYRIDSVEYIIYDRDIAVLLVQNGILDNGIKCGMAFSTDVLENERKRLAGWIANKGYFKFNKDFIRYEADSTRKNGLVDVSLKLMRFKESNNSPERNHQVYKIDDIWFSTVGGRNIPLRKNVLAKNTVIKKGATFCTNDVQNTYDNFARLQNVQFTNIQFIEKEDSLIDCNISIGTRKPNTISFRPEGTNTAGDLGAAVSLTYDNNNIFRGGELFSVQLRGAYEAITGLEGYQNKNYVEYNMETRLLFPRAIVPFVSRQKRRQSNSMSELMLNYNMQNRPEFHRRVLTSAWRYYWNGLKNTTYRLDLVDINYIHMPWISPTFKREYLDDTNNRNSILKYNYEDLFILRTGINVAYRKPSYAIKTNVEIGGNLLNAVSQIIGEKKNDEGQYTLFNIAYAQYVKGDFDFTKLLKIDRKNSFVFHFGLGIAYPYGNSKVLPFEKRYFSGGANSVRGWNVRELGPGKYKGTNGGIDFINQTGDMKIDINAELRTSLFWKINGAAFIDAGNIWTLKNYKDQPEGQFKFSDFYKQLAAAYGVGIRVNFDYFIVRVDLGMKAVNPAYNSSKEHFPIINPKMSRDLSVHFAVGMPF